VDDADLASPSWLERRPDKRKKRERVATADWEADSAKEWAFL
jgi:hypothetical protein